MLSRKAILLTAVAVVFDLVRTVEVGHGGGAGLEARLGPVHVVARLLSARPDASSRQRERGRSAHWLRGRGRGGEPVIYGKRRMITDICPSRVILRSQEENISSHAFISRHNQCNYSILLIKYFELRKSVL